MLKRILTKSSYLLFILLTILAFQAISTNAYTAESARSSEVSAISDRTPPPAPTGLQLTLDGNGVKAVWQNPPQSPFSKGGVNDLPAAYHLYRSNSPITTITNLTPISTSATLTATDPSPASTQRYYAVTALDTYGNESAPSDTIEITFPVAPVKNLILARIDNGKPALTWEASETNIQGYYIYRNGSKINQTPTISTTYTDGYYTGGTVKYGISEVNNLNIESPIKEVMLPDISIGIKQGTTLRRGVLETVTILVSGQWTVVSGQNPENITIDTINLKLGALPESALPGPFTLNSATPTPLEITKVVATDLNAQTQAAVLITAIINPSPGTTIKITKTSVANIMPSSTTLEIYNEPMIKGGQAKVRLKINNLGTARMEFLTSENNTTTTQVKINLKDQDGNLLATGYLDQRTGSVINIGSYSLARLNPGENILTDPITFNVLTSAPYKVIIEAEIQNTYYHYNQPDQVTAPGLKQSVDTVITETSYRAIASPEKTIYKRGETIKIIGKAISNITPSPSPLTGEGQGGGETPMPNVPVKIGISVKGFDRYFTINTDNNGNFSYTFTPATNEAGTYTIWAVHPDINDRTVQAQFSIIGLDMTPAFANIKMAKNSSFDIPITLKNPGDTALTNLAFTITTSSGITAGVINNGDTALTANETQNLSLRISADGAAGDIGYATLTVGANSVGELLSSRLDANITLIQAIPIIKTTPSYIDTGIKRSTQRIETFTITNTGLETLKNARLEGPSTPWMTLINDKNIGDLKPGQSTTIGIMLKPSETLKQAIYDDRIIINSDNHIPYTFNIQVTVTSNAIGSVLFDVLNELMEDVSGATITIQHQLLTELIYTIKTGQDGTILLNDIPEGRYTYNITAAGHKTYSGSFTIYPGITVTVPIALEVNMIDIQWSITEIPLQDRYEIKITQTFETNVPTTVIIIEPPAITLPDMLPGDIYNGEFTITNYGYIAADYKGINFPQSFDDYDIEILANIPSRINAMQKITVPYRITRRQQIASTQFLPLYQRGIEGDLVESGLSTFSQATSLITEVMGYGGSTCLKSITITTNWEQTICPNTANERKTTKTGTYTITYNVPGCGGGPPGIDDGYYDDYGYIGGTGGGGQGGGGWLPGGGYTTIAAEECFSPQCSSKVCENDTRECAGSSVILANGTYEFSETDLKIPARSIPIEWKRTYRSNDIRNMAGFGDPANGPLGYGWMTPYLARIEGRTTGYILNTGDNEGYIYRDGEGRHFTFKKDANGNFITDTENGLTLRHTSNIFSAGLTTDTGYELKETGGNTQTFDATGRLREIKDPHGNTVTLNYDTNGNFTNIKDAVNRTVLSFTYDTNNHITQATDIAGRITNYEYDSFGNLTKVTDTGGQIHTYLYNSYHGITSKTNPLNETYTIEYQYPDRGIASKVTDPLNNFTTYQYDFANKTFYVTDKNGRKVKKTINDKGKLTSEVETINNTIIKKIDYLDNRTERHTDSADNITTIQKDEWGNIIKSTDGESSQTIITYNTQKRPTSITNPLGNVTRFEYDTTGTLLTKVTQAEAKPEQIITTYTYNQYGEIITKTEGNAVTAINYNTIGLPTEIKDPMGNTTTIQYDTYGNAAAVIDPSNNMTEFTYNTIGSLLTIKDQLGNITNHTYNAANRLTSVKDPLNRVTNTETDFKNRITAVTDAIGNKKAYKYDGNGNLIKITDGVNITTMTYDSADRLTSITDAEGNTTNYEYATSAVCTTCGGSTENPAKITDPIGNITQYIFDKNGRVIDMRDPLNNLSNTIYDAGGRITSQTDANSNITRYQYDALNKITKQTDSNNGETTFSYDSRGNLITLTDPNANTTLFEYDLADRKTKETRQMGQVVEYAYYPNGLLKTAKDAKSQITTYAYDAANRLTTITYADGKKETFVYDAVGNMIQTDTVAAGFSLRYVYAYDELNRKINETINYGAFSKTYSYTYDAQDNKTSFTSPEGKTYNYTYNKNNQPTSIAFDNRTINLNYQWDRMIKATLPNGNTTDYQYNANSWLNYIITKQATTTLQSNQYSFDKVGNILTKNTEQGNYTYNYDNLYQITQSINPVLPQETFAYDKSGNRLTETIGLNSAISYTHNSNNELLNAGVATYSYDANGNTTQETNGSQIIKYIYNSSDRLEKVELPDGRIAVYSYDPFGRRISKTVDNVTTYFLYADEGLIGEYDAAGNLKKSYGWMPDSIWGTNPIYLFENGNYYFYHNDHLGTPQKITDEIGNIVWSATYTAFGEVVVNSTSTVTNNLRFPGQYYDAETGKHYNWNRYYDTKTGRYTQVDPIGFGAGDVNLYRYAFSNPVNLTDPTGEIIPIIIPIAKGVLLLYDLYETYKTITDPCTGKEEISKEIGYYLIGMVLPGGKQGTKQAVKGLGGNPFKGKTTKQIDKMFRAKGFITKGPDPISGRGSYINPQTGRKYYTDPGGTYKKGIEPPHVDIHRPEGSQLPKKKFPYGG